MNALPHVMQQGTGWITAEFERIGRLITDRQASSKQVVEYHMRQKLYRSFFTEPIPKVVHFIKTDADPSNFNIIHYISVRSASWHIKPTTIKFHCHVEPQGKYWEMLRRNVPELVVVPIDDNPNNIGGKPIRMAAHQSDVLRLQVLLREGGIYLVRLRCRSIPSLPPPHSWVCVWCLLVLVVERRSAQSVWLCG
jgi:hypothetical protein